MQSLRMLGRIAPRAPFRPLSSRCYSAVSKSYLRPSLQAFKKSSYPAFSTSIAKREPAGDGDQLLATKLESERALEVDSTDPANANPELEKFRSSGVWEVIDHPGTHEITLQRSFGDNETIKVEMSITDMTDMAEDEWDQDMDDDAALADEGFEQPKRTINQSGASGRPVDVVSEDQVAPADRDGEFADGDATPSYPINIDITVTKPGNQKIEIRAAVQDGAVQTHEIQYLPAEPAGDDNTTPYAGPPFNNLDGDLQVMFEQYLEERGVNEELAQILPILIEAKEQREYVDWLSNMKKFIEA